MKNFYDSIEAILRKDTSLIDQLQGLRDLLTASLNSNEFKLDCIEALINSIESAQGEEWKAPEFFYHEELKFSVRMIYWPAFYENNPHEHKTWSVTGVFHNSLNIATYQMLESPRRLRKDKSINASDGQAGYLVPGCIHNVKNPTDKLSCSLHIFNYIDSLNSEENAIWYPAPRNANLASGLLDRALVSSLLSLANIKGDRAIDLINRIYYLGSDSTKFSALQAMFSCGKRPAKLLFEKLEFCYES